MPKPRIHLGVRDASTIREIEAVIAIEVYHPPKKERKRHKSLAQIAEERADAERGVILPPPNHRIGRPPGSKSKPKEGDEWRDRAFTRQHRARRFGFPLRLDTVDRVFAMHNHTIWRKVKSGLLNTMAVRKQYCNAPRAKYHGNVVYHDGDFYDANTVAWWLIHRSEVPDGYVVDCDDKTDNPRFSADNLHLVRTKTSA